MLDFLLAAFPIAFLIVAMTKKNPISSPVAFLLAALLTLVLRATYFGTDGLSLAASVVAGLLHALTPIAIVFGAIFFFVAMDRSGAMAIIREWLRGISPNPVAQIMIVGWSFMFLIEGASGFGTPAALAAPILVGLGFPALRVAALCLIFNALPTPFGAVGTPLWFGFEPIGLSEADLLTVGWKTAIWQAGAALIVPVVALRLVLDGATLRKNLVFIYLSILASIVPMVLLALINYEFPSVVGGSIGLGLTILIAHLGWGLSAGEKEPGIASPHLRTLLRALLPLGLTVGILLLTRIPLLGLRSLLTKSDGGLRINLGEESVFSISPSLVFTLENIFGQDLRWSHALLYVPSLIPFILTGGFALWLFGASGKVVRESFTDTVGRVKKPVLALFGALVFVNLLMVGGERSSTLLIGEFFAQAAGDSWIFLAPFLGALGSFFSGSTTISNLTFGAIQASIAEQSDLSTTLLLALQCAGGSMGNMVCIHNIVAVCAVLGLTNQEGKILKMVFPFLLLHGAALAFLTLILS